MFASTPRPSTPDMLFPALVSPTAAQLLALLQQLETTQYLPPDELRARQFRQIGALVAHIDRAVPFYGLSLRKAGLKSGAPITEEIWANVPILTRRLVQDAGDALKAREIPAHHGQIFTMGTSGSTGTPLTVWKTELEQLYWNAFTLREECWHRRDFTAIFAAIRYDRARDMARGDPPTRRLPDWGPPVNAVHATGPALLCDVRTPIPELAALLRAEAPAYLLSFPSILGALARHCRDNDIALPSLRGLRGSGEALPEQTRTMCQEVFGLDIADMYSAVETGHLAIQCPEHASYHVQAESALLEVLDADGAPCSPGQVGRVVITPLHNFAMPLIRYEIGDLAEVGPPCLCGRTSLVLRRILGRQRDMLRLPSGGWRFPEYGNCVLHSMRAVIQNQAVQAAHNLVEIRLVARQPLTEAEEATILAAARRELGEPFEVQLTYHAEIPRGPGGKYQEFRCDVPD